MVVLPLPATIDGGAAPTVESDAEMVAAVTVMPAVCVIAVPLIVAETVFDSATAELSDPVATPLAFVTPAGWTRVFPAPVAASTTVELSDPVATPLAFVTPAGWTRVFPA